MVGLNKENNERNPTIQKISSLYDVMKVHTYTPSHADVQNVIKRYIFLESEHTHQTFTCFPNTNHCLGIVVHKKVKSLQKNVVRLVSSNTHTHYISGIYIKPLHFTIEGRYKELCIDFKPLAFESMGLPTKFQGSFIVEPFKDTYSTLIDNLYELITHNHSVSQADIIQELDQIFTKVIKEEQDHCFTIINDDQIGNIDTYKQLLYQSERSLYRYFTKHLAITPYKYLEIKKLQKCLKDINQSKELKHVVYDNDFVDYSHLNKLFKRYTNLSPSDFKRSISFFNDLTLQL